MDYLTEEELYELQYADDMDVLDEINSAPSCTFESRKQLDPPVDKEIEVIGLSAGHNASSKQTFNTENSSMRKCQKRIFSEVEVTFESDSYTIDNAIEIHRQLDSPTDEITEIAPYSKILHREVSTSETYGATDHSIKKCQKRLFSEMEEISVDPDTSGIVSEFKRQKPSSCDSVPIKSFLSSSLKGDKFEQLPITKSDGSKGYFRLYEDENDETSIFSFAKNTSGLLTVPISTLKTNIYLQLEEKLALEKSQENNASVEIINEDICEVPRENDELWVEKYRPRCYIDLLSDEGINRMLLFWLKLWDKVVFGKENKKPKKEKPKPQTQYQQQTKFQKTFKELMEEHDEHGRPHHKVAFLCGPPGLGKTTLAHIIGNHAGYNVVEFNASDDRNPDAFRVNLEAATQMKSVLDRDPRPNCLVIDEIDGAPAPSINVLLSFVKSIGSVKGKRKKGDLPILMRPIICICNDQYVPALKSLKQLAFVLNFPPTAPRRLASRLQEIAICQCLKADMNALILLCEKADNDVRSCLSTLQFVYHQKKTLTTSDISGMEIGLKDVQKSLFSVWLEVFHLSKNKSNVPRAAGDNTELKDFIKNDSSLKSRFHSLLKTVQTCAEYEKLVNGLFENYLNINFKDTHLDKLWQGPEWLCFSDLIQQNIAHSQLYILMPYLPYVPVAFHTLFASSTYPQISYPSSLYECNLKRTQFLNILTSIVNDVVASIKGFMNFTLLVLDLLPALVEIIKPTLRPVNTQLYSEREKAELHHVIEVMIAFNLNYRQERSIEGQYSYVLDPNIESLVHFTGLKTKRVLTYSTKQLISREVELEKLRGSEGDSKEISKKTTSHFKPNAANQLNVKTKEILPEMPNLDFFGRKIEKKMDVATESSKAEAAECDIWFHFKEGYSNAVRRTVWIQDLL